MKNKLIALVIVSLFLIAVSAPATNFGDGPVMGKVVCKVCTKACDKIAEKCYAQVKEGSKLSGLCQKLDEACHAKCPCE
jgi:hypothetical protein